MGRRHIQRDIPSQSRIFKSNSVKDIFKKVNFDLDFIFNAQLLLQVPRGEGKLHEMPHNPDTVFTCSELHQLLYYSND